MKHTKGPWHAHYITACAEEADGEYMTATAITNKDEATYKRTGGRGDLIAFVPHDRAHESNARLIAAAPDLLTALEVAASCNIWRGYEQERATVLAALAKARGE